MESFEQATAVSRAPFFIGLLGMAYALSGYHEKANEVLRSLDELERKGPALFAPVQKSPISG